MKYILIVLLLLMTQISQASTLTQSEKQLVCETGKSIAKSTIELMEEGVLVKDIEFMLHSIDKGYLFIPLVKNIYENKFTLLDEPNAEKNQVFYLYKFYNTCMGNDES